MGFGQLWTPRFYIREEKCRSLSELCGNNYPSCGLTEMLFSVALDRWVSSNPLIYFETLLAQGANIWLGTQIGSDSEACPHHQQHGRL